MNVSRLNSRHKRKVLVEETTFLFGRSGGRDAGQRVSLDFMDDDDLKRKETYRLEMTDGEALWLADYLTRVLTNIYTRDADAGKKEQAPPEIQTALEQRAALGTSLALQNALPKGGWAREIDRLTKIIDAYRDTKEASRFGGGLPTDPALNHPGGPLVSPPADRPGPMSASRSPRRPHGKERP